MIDGSEIEKIRRDRQELINLWRKDISYHLFMDKIKENDLGPIQLKFYEINEEYRYKANKITLRDKKERLQSRQELLDHEDKYENIGKIFVNLENREHKFKLFQKMSDKTLYVYHGPMGEEDFKGALGSITRVFRVNDDFIIDFNTSVLQACFHGLHMICPITTDGLYSEMPAGEYI